MREPTPLDPVEPMRRQIGRLRRRRNGYETARALLLLSAAAAGAAATVVVLALRAGPRVFALGAAAATGAALLAAAALASATRRRWLGRVRAAGWIDRQAGLEGRLATLVELVPRGVPFATSLFLPLLIEENRRRMAGWRPAALVPDAVPRRALGAALAAIGALVLALVLAPALEPPLPEVFYGAAIPAGARAEIAVPGRVLLARVEAGGTRPAAPPSRSVAAELQRRIRRRLWGADREAAHEAAARAAERTEERHEDRAAGEEQSARAGEAAEVARADAASAERAATDRADTGGEPGDVADGDPPPREREPSPARDAAAGSGDAAHGAGTATDPRLLGPPTDPRAGAATFDLPIVARVRSLGGGPRPPAGDAPAPSPDARPQLGAGQRGDAPVVRGDVPPAYEPIVRAMFAHRGAVAP